MKSLTIGKSRIGDNFSTYIIAEIGGNFSTFEQGKTLIDAATSCGANAVKIQTFKADKLVSTYAIFDMPSVGGRKKQLDVIRKLELNEKIQKKLFGYCTNKKITFFSTPSHPNDVDFLENIGIKLYKIGSDDLTNIPLIKYISKCKKPTIISTGMSNMKEIKDAVEAYSSQNNKLALLHCVSMYPYDPKYSNLNAINTMKKEFKIPIGWSDHTKGIEICIAAVALGANIVEKHFTLNKKAKGPDHVLSSDPRDFSNMVKSIRLIEAAKGTGMKKPAKCELSSLKNVRKSIVASKDIPAGTILTDNFLEIKRPGNGISPNKLNLIIGKRIKKMVMKDKPIKMDYLQ